MTIITKRENAHFIIIIALLKEKIIYFLVVAFSKWSNFAFQKFSQFRHKKLIYDEKMYYVSYLNDFPCLQLFNSCVIFIQLLNILACVNKLFFDQIECHNFPVLARLLRPPDVRPLHESFRPEFRGKISDWTSGHHCQRLLRLCSFFRTFWIRTFQIRSFCSKRFERHLKRWTNVQSKLKVLFSKTKI